MDKVKFFALSLVSLFTTVMLWVDGLFSRRAAESGVPVESIGQADSFAFWRLWVPLIVVQIVVVTLIHRLSGTRVQRNIVYFGVFLFVMATLYALTGFQQLGTTLQ